MLNIHFSPGLSCEIRQVCFKAWIIPLLSPMAAATLLRGISSRCCMVLSTLMLVAYPQRVLTETYIVSPSGDTGFTLSEVSIIKLVWSCRALTVDILCCCCCCCFLSPSMCILEGSFQSGGDGRSSSNLTIFHRGKRPQISDQLSSRDQNSKAQYLRLHIEWPN